MFKPLEQELLRIKSAGTERRFPYLRKRSAGLAEVGDRHLVDFANFDYLGLANNQRVVKASQQAIELHGVSQSPSRVSAGSLPELISAEDRLARFFGMDGAIFFSSRNQALLSLLSAVANQGDLVAYDSFAHAPIADASYLLELSPLTYSLENIETLNEFLERSIINPLCLYAEGVSPVTGELFPLQWLQRKITPDKRFHLIVDESYAASILGERGSGAYEASGTIFPSLSIIGSFGIGIPGYGGFVAAKGVVIDYLKQTSRAIETESATPAHIAAAIEAAIDTLELEILARKKILHNALRVRSALIAAGVPVTGGNASPILSVTLERLLTKGILVELVGLRSYRKEIPVIRVVVNRAHSHVQLDTLIEILIESCLGKL
jgi:7-keto-8-aminopelargonate synthetase-like enzyme